MNIFCKTILYYIYPTHQINQLKGIIDRCIFIFQFYLTISTLPSVFDVPWFAWFFAAEMPLSAVAV